MVNERHYHYRSRVDEMKTIEREFRTDEELALMQSRGKYLTSHEKQRVSAYAERKRLQNRGKA